ncbi:unnamed protein product [Ambrosiozyma monospora]|uniref:Unnamed protein product n=1 Tax=Ambrosiozyma monospora TaxID=43982 RepID=A0ACB5T2F2_AMBMO|nr:unnamed protein product [Ambrosiozyma monospora]
MSNPSNFNYSSQSSQIEPDLNLEAISTTSDPDEPKPTTAFRGNEFHEKDISFKLVRLVVTDTPRELA